MIARDLRAVTNRHQANEAWFRPCQEIRDRGGFRAASRGSVAHSSSSMTQSTGRVRARRIRGTSTFPRPRAVIGSPWTAGPSFQWSDPSLAPVPPARPPGRRRRSAPSRRPAARRCRGAATRGTAGSGSPSTGSNSHQWLCMPNRSPWSRAIVPAALQAEIRSCSPASESNRGSRGQPCQMIFEHRHSRASSRPELDVRGRGQVAVDRHDGQVMTCEAFGQASRRQARRQRGELDGREAGRPSPGATPRPHPTRSRRGWSRAGVQRRRDDAGLLGDPSSAHRESTSGLTGRLAHRPAVPRRPAQQFTRDRVALAELASTGTFPDLAGRRYDCHEGTRLDQDPTEADHGGFSG